MPCSLWMKCQSSAQSHLLPSKKTIRSHSKSPITLSNPTIRSDQGWTKATFLSSFSRIQSVDIAVAQATGTETSIALLIGNVAYKLNFIEVHEESCGRLAAVDRHISIEKRRGRVCLYIPRSHTSISTLAFSIGQVYSTVDVFADPVCWNKVTSFSSVFVK